MDQEQIEAWGIKNWNKWRGEYPLKPIRLQNEDLEGLKAGIGLGEDPYFFNGKKLLPEGFNLAGANLIGANLRGSNLTGANLTKANLSGADLSHADLRHADLNGADLRGAKLTGTDLRGCNICGAYLDGAWVGSGIKSGKTGAGYVYMLTLDELTRVQKEREHSPAITVKVTQKNIAEGGQDCNSCALFLALMDYGAKEITVADTISCLIEGTRRSWQTTRDIDIFISDFDTDQERVKPFTLVLGGDGFARVQAEAAK